MKDTKAASFFARHRRRSWSPVFNGMLEAMIREETLCLELRAVAWVIRYSWGNHSESVVNGEGIIQTQSDFARLVGRDRRTVNPAFRALRSRGIIQTRGQEILPIDDPVFADSLPTAEGPETNRENKAKYPSFQAFIEEIVAKFDPDTYKEYQKAEERRKQLRTNLLQRYDDYLKHLSEGPETIGPDRPEAQGQAVGGRKDTLAEAHGQSPGASLLPLEQKNLIAASSSFSKSRGALSFYAGITDDDAFKDLLARTRKVCPDFTDDELEHFIHLKGRTLKRELRNPMGFLLTAVPRMFDSDDFRAYRREQQRALSASS